MDSEKFHQYWNYIEDRAFYPIEKKKIKIWLREFLKCFNRLYEKESRWPTLKLKNSKFALQVNLGPHGIQCDGSVSDDLSTFSINLKWNETSLQFGYDQNYDCEFSHLRKPSRRMSNDFNSEDLKKVLKNKIDHPPLHFHIHSPLYKRNGRNREKIGDFPHKVRIGFGSQNPLFFLYQLSFQLLSTVDETKKQKELDRLTNIIYENRKKDKISAGTLFNR